MFTVDQMQEYLLDCDLLTPRSWQLFSDGTRLVQKNGTNPKIRELPMEKVNEYAAFTDKLIVYEARIIKDLELKPLIRPDRNWQISFDNGTSKTNFQPLLIKESKIQDLAWHVILSR